MSQPLSPQGGFPANPLTKPGYVLEFHDEFDGPDLSTEKWLPFYLPHWSSREKTRPDFMFENGCLVLRIGKDRAPWCPEFDGEVRCSSIQTGAFSGPLGSPVGQLRFNPACLVREEQPNVRLYTPLYGYFEIRARGPATGANHASLWMIGYEDSPESSGEIAVFELLGSRSGPLFSGIRYGVHPWSDPDLQEQFFDETVDIDTREFHVYAVEWKPESIDFYLDNRRLRTLPQSPRYPMQFMLSLYEHPFEGAWSGVYDPLAPYPKEFAVDYIRAYRPVGGYSKNPLQ